MSVDAKTVKLLKDKTGSGLMNCKKALVEAEGDFDKAIEILRKKGIADASKKAGRAANQGLIESYIHDNRIGVLVEINSETDFVARTDEFKKFVKDITLQIAAIPPIAVTKEAIPAEVIEKEKEIYREQLKKAGKPENVIEKIIEGKLEKFYKENVLLMQEFYRDEKRTVEDVLKETIGSLKENIIIKRFARFELGVD